VQVTAQNVAQTSMGDDEAVPVRRKMKACGAFGFILGKSCLEGLPGVLRKFDLHAPNIHEVRFQVWSIRCV